MRRLKLLVAVCVAAACAGLPGVAMAAPGNPGDSKNCGDFANWNQANVWFETYQPDYGDIANLDSDHDLFPCETLPGTPPNAPAPASSGGYWMVEGNGSVFGFGDALPLAPIVRDNVVAAAGSKSGGYWLLTGSGAVTTRAEPHFGNANVGFLDQASAISALPDGSGYWVFSRRGAVQALGAAQNYGDMSAAQLNGQIVASAVTPSGLGYWLVGSDGGIFSFGDAAFSGSTGAMRLNEPVVGIAADPDGLGYWLVAADGGIFAFDAPYRGSVPEALGPEGHLNRPVIGALAYGNGYLMVASDGGIFAFSNQPFFGSLGATPPPNPIVAVAVRPAPTTGSVGGGGSLDPTTPTTQPQPDAQAPGRIDAAPQAFGRAASARLVFGAAPANGNAVLHYQFNAFRTGRYPPNGTNESGWKPIDGGPGEVVVALQPDNTPSATTAFQVRACNDHGQCGEGSPFSAITSIYNPVLAPEISVSRNEGSAQWTWREQSAGNTLYGKWAPVSYFIVNLDGSDVAQIPAVATGDVTNLDTYIGAFTSQHALDNRAHTLRVTAVATLDGVDFHGPQGAKSLLVPSAGSTFNPTLSAQNLTSGIVRVSWDGGDGFFPTKLARNGTDVSGFGTWDTDMLAPPGIPLPGLLSKTFDFTGLPYGTYIFTLSYPAGGTGAASHPAGELAVQLRL